MEVDAHALHDSLVMSLSVGASLCLQCSMNFLCSASELRLRKIQLLKELQMVLRPPSHAVQASQLTDPRER